MAVKKRYILDTTKRSGTWNTENPEKRQQNETTLAKTANISRNALLKWKTGGDKEPNWLSKALAVKNFVPSKYTEIVKKDGDIFSIDYKKIKTDYDKAHPDKRATTIQEIMTQTGCSGKSAKWVGVLYLLCESLECDLDDIIFEV